MSKQLKTKPDKLFVLEEIQPKVPDIITDIVVNDDIFQSFNNKRLINFKHVALIDFEESQGRYYCIFHIDNGAIIKSPEFSNNLDLNNWFCGLVKKAKEMSELI